MSLFKREEDVHNTLYVIVTIFNPRNFNSRYRLYRQFKKYLNQFSNVKLVTVEIAYWDREFVVTSHKNEWDLQLRSNDEMWHKERAINLGLNHLLTVVPDAKYMAWIDPDVQFANPNWVKETIYELHHHKIVQPFSEAINLNSKYEYMWNCQATFRQHFDRGYTQDPPLPRHYFAGGHPGLAWAARVSTILELGGLLDVCIAGSADTHMANALKGDYSLFMAPGISEEFKEAMQKWQNKCDIVVKGSIGFVNGVCFHYWHGKSEERGYEKRWEIISFHQYNPNTDIEVSESGLYKFSDNKPNLVADLKRSMSQRNEDEL